MHDQASPAIPRAWRAWRRKWPLTRERNGGASGRFYRSGRSPLNKRGPTWILEHLLTNLFDHQLIHLSINTVEYFLLLSKVEIMLGVADNNDFDLETYNHAS
jgi:hypothetical protein